MKVTLINYKRFKKDIEFNHQVIKSKVNAEIFSLRSLEKVANLEPLITFLVLGEDRRFYKHIGFDVVAILRAIRNRIFYRKREGASTIEQQLVRVLTNQFERTYRRKLKEIILATKLKRILTKNQIALLYLKTAYYGTGKHGLFDVLTSYNLNVGDKIGEEACAEIVARLKYPEPKEYNPSKWKLIDMRRNHLLKLYNRYGKPH